MKLRIPLSLSILLFAASALATACGPTVTLQTPPGFAVLPKQTEYIYRAASADGVVLAVRVEQNKPTGNLDFWAEVLDTQLRQGGYKPDGKPEDVKSATGIPGKRLKYTRQNQGRTYRYWVSVYVTETHVYCVEAGGDEDRFKGKALETIQKASDSATFG
ncbi:MAG: hypothetical protein ABJE95_24480 [Byssovorax sp.]